MVEPSDDSGTSLTEQAIYLRGLFMHRYGAIEFALGELLTRARCLPVYGDTGDLPFRFGTKVGAAEALLARPGPIAAYRTQLEPPLAELETFEVYRNMLAHGLLTVSPADPPMVKLRSFEHVKGRGLGLVICDMPLWQLEWLCDAMKPLSTGIVPTVARICIEVPLPQVEIDPLEPHPKARIVRNISSAMP